jgi:colanic acid/amylovoran biosynthesis glycosyltransferase
MPNPVTENAPAAPPQRAVVASYVVTFLKPEMLHVYRQVRGLSRWRTVVFCQKRENEKAFPLDEVRVFPKPATHQLRRWWQKKVKGAPITIYQGEARRLREALLREGARLLHVYFGHIAVHLLPLLEIAPVPVVVSFHGADAQVDLDKPRHRAAAQRVFTLARLILVRSESLGARLVEVGCPREKIRINRTGIPLDGIPFRQREAPADGTWRCLQASRLIAKKGLATTLDAFAVFAKAHPLARLTFAGEGPLREDLWRRVVKLGIPERVNFTGFLGQHELRALFAQAHLFLHPSEHGPDGDQEGVPNAMLEAMASGLPTLATEHGGIPEAIEDGVSGLLSPERDAEKLGAHMLALAADPARYAAMSRAASERIAKVFDIRSTVAALEGIYDEALR